VEPPEEDVIEDTPIEVEEPSEAPPLDEKEVVNALKTTADFAKVIQLKALLTQELQDVVDELKSLVEG